MEIVKSAIVGSIESNDILIKVEKSDTLEIVLESAVMKQYGTDIYNTIEAVLKEMNVTKARVEAKDKGALDFTIRARVKTAIKHASALK